MENPKTNIDTSTTTTTAIIIIIIYYYYHYYYIIIIITIVDTGHTPGRSGSLSDGHPVWAIRPT